MGAFLYRPGGRYLDRREWLGRSSSPNALAPSHTVNRSATAPAPASPFSQRVRNTVWATIGPWNRLI
jgi:hypothetical protein